MTQSWPVLTLSNDTGTFLCGLGRNERIRDWICIFDFLPNGRRVVFPSELKGKPISGLILGSDPRLLSGRAPHFHVTQDVTNEGRCPEAKIIPWKKQVISFPLDGKRVWEEVEELVIPETILGIQVSNLSFPNLKKLVIRPKNPQYSSRGGAICSKNGNILFYSLAADPEKPFSIPKSVTMVQSTAFQDTLCPDILVEGALTDIAPYSFLDSAYARDKDFLCVGNFFYHLYRPVPVLEMPSQVNKVHYAAFYDCLPRTLASPCLFPSSEVLNPTRNNNDRKGSLRHFKLTDPKASLSLLELRSYDCLESITVPPDHVRYESVEGVLFDKLQKRLLFYPRSRKEESYTVPEGTVSIGPSAFEGCPLKEIIVPDSVREIGDRAFSRCENLTRLVLSDQVEMLLTEDPVGYEGVASLCPKLSDVTLGSSLKVLGGGAFLGSSLTQLDLPEGLLLIQENCLDNDSLKSLRLPSTLMNIEKGAISSCRSVQAFEGTARGLVNALFPSAYPDHPLSTVIEILDPEGLPKGVLYIPVLHLAQKRLQHILSLAWDYPALRGEAYEEAFEDTKDPKCQLYMAAILVLQEGREGSALSILKKQPALALKVLKNLPWPEKVRKGEAYLQLQQELRDLALKASST